MYTFRQSKIRSILMLFCFVLAAQQAALADTTPLNVTATVIEDTPLKLRIDWFGKELWDPNSPDNHFNAITIDNPSLTHWKIGEITVDSSCCRPFKFEFKDVHHVTNPHPGEANAPSVAMTLSFDYFSEYESGVVNTSVVHPGPEMHEDFYNLSWSYGSPPPAPRNSDLRISLKAAHVPAPLPVFGIGAAFGSIRRLRKFSSQLKTFALG